MTAGKDDRTSSNSRMPCMKVGQTFLSYGRHALTG